MSIYLEMGAKLKQLRLDAGILQMSELAAKLKKNKSYLSRVENGHELPSPGFIKEVVDVLGLSEDEEVELLSLHRKLKVGTSGEVGEDGVGTSQLSVKIVVPNDLNKLYADAVFINSDGNGVSFEFTQTFGPRPKEHKVVARIGMSYDHAKKLLDSLGQNLQAAIELKDRRS